MLAIEVVVFRNNEKFVVVVVIVVVDVFVCVCIRYRDGILYDEIVY